MRANLPVIERDDGLPAQVILMSITDRLGRVPPATAAAAAAPPGRLLP